MNDRSGEHCVVPISVLAPTMKLILTINIAAAVVLLTNVSANSGATGSCAAGIDAIGGTHLDFGPNSTSKREGGVGTLFEGATTVEIDGITLTADTPTTFPANTDLTWTVSTERVPFKGIFVRAQAADDNAFTHTGVGTDLQNVALCNSVPGNVKGVSHNSPALKAESSGILNFSLDGPVTVDISIVYDNTDLAVSAFSSYPLIIGEVPPTPPPTSVAPVPVASTPSPTLFPTPTPFSDSPEPVLTDFPAPTPVEPPSDTPVPTKECSKGNGGKKCMGGMKMGGKEGMKMDGKEGMKMDGNGGMKMDGKEGAKKGGMTGDNAAPKSGSKGEGGMGKTKGERRRYLK
jgi:hypothetical protein